MLREVYKVVSVRAYHDEGYELPRVVLESFQVCLATPDDR